MTKKKERTRLQADLAQFFTSSSIANFMASFFHETDEEARILDPGAGLGILGKALLSDLSQKTETTYVELDEETAIKLESSLAENRQEQVNEVISGDFLSVAQTWITERRTFTHIILNPPYFKINVSSMAHKKLKEMGIQVTNIYAAFLWLSGLLLEEGGQIVAIVPRSFCNGPYFGKFRSFLNDTMSIEGIHIFESRSKAFSGDNVLQENIIIHLKKGKQVKKVKVTYSNDGSFSGLRSKMFNFSEIIDPNDRDKVIRIPQFENKVQLGHYAKSSLNHIGISVSTGPLVDFRHKDQLSHEETTSSLPLIYPLNVRGLNIAWPRQQAKKAQYFVAKRTSGDPTLDKFVLPLDGFYVLVKRFSSKEERRRIVASVVSPDEMKHTHIVFENHVNFFHVKKHGFDRTTAYGLWAYLNSSIADEHFRKVSGHTQVNVSDLKSFPYPDLDTLKNIGSFVEVQGGVSDGMISDMILGKK